MRAGRPRAIGQLASVEPASSTLRSLRVNSGRAGIELMVVPPAIVPTVSMWAE